MQIEEKLEVAFAGNLGVSRSLVKGATSVQRYLAIKTGASLSTCLIVAAALMGLDFAVLWGVLGRRLGLSPFVVILCLFFWGWMWGAAGMLLAVPMTVVVELLLVVSPETRWLAIFLGGTRETAELRRQAESSDGSPAGF